MRRLNPDTVHRWLDRGFRTMVYLFGFGTMAILLVILFYIFSQGIGALNIDFFLREPQPMGKLGGGIAQALLGTLEMGLVATLIAAPLGTLTAVYLYKAKSGWFPEAVGFCLDLIAGVPSILVGLFIWVGVVKMLLGHFAGIAGALALAMIMLPMIARPLEEVLLKINDQEFKSARALGIPRWRIIMSVVLPVVRRDLLAITVFAIARAIGETAPLMLTALGNDHFNTNLNQPMGATTLSIWEYSGSPYADLHQKAFGLAAVMIVIVFVGLVTTHWISRKKGVGNDNTSSSS